MIYFLSSLCGRSGKPVLWSYSPRESHIQFRFILTALLLVLGVSPLNFTRIVSLGQLNYC